MSTYKILSPQGLGDFAAATAAGVMSLEEGSGNLR